MRITGREKLDAFCEKHADARKWIEAWLNETEGVSWRTPLDVKQRHASASLLSGNVVIFSVEGNEYRAEAIVAYKVGVVTIKWVGTHSEYDDRNRKR